MHITIDTSEPLSDLDKHILTALAGVTSPAVKVTEEAAPAKKAAAAPAKKAAAAPAKVEEPEPDLIGDDEPTLESAVARATKLIADGQQAGVKAALTDVGAARVSTLEADQVAPFMAALDAAGI